MTSLVRVVLDYACSIEGQPEKHIHVGDTFELLKKTSSSWWHVRRDSVETAFYVPTSCVEEIVPNTADVTSLSLNSPRRGISRSESSLDRLHASSATNIQPPSGDAAYLSSSSGEDLERGEHYDNPVYALPNVTFLRHIAHEFSDISTEVIYQLLPSFSTVIFDYSTNQLLSVYHLKINKLSGYMKVHYISVAILLLSFNYRGTNHSYGISVIVLKILVNDGIIFDRFPSMSCTCSDDLF